ncbi:hypothetical protein NQZ68_024509 [Dissostichus eleginoides]|nr:hypothetical protein NQZ68_024509 [Dissostichus eleginoides]
MYNGLKSRLDGCDRFFIVRQQTEIHNPEYQTATHSWNTTLCSMCSGMYDVLALRPVVIERSRLWLLNHGTLCQQTYGPLSL